MESRSGTSLLAIVEEGCAVSFPHLFMGFQNGSLPWRRVPPVKGGSDRLARPLIPKSTAKSTPGSKPGFRQRKALGQHFLVSGRILNRIVAAAELTKDDLVVEVGPGSGALTRYLVEKAGRVLAVEVDPDLARSLSSRLGAPPSLSVIEADARTVDIDTLIPAGVPYKLVANLPYYAANPIVRRFLEASHKPSLMVLTLQQEVAQGMAALPGKMTMLSAAVQLFARPTLICTVPPDAFRPPPKVNSAVIRLDVIAGLAVDVGDPDDFFTTVRAGFSSPRKQLRNSLSHGLGVQGSEVDGLLEAASLDGVRRPATLTLEEWAHLHLTRRGAWQAAV